MTTTEHLERYAHLYRLDGWTNPHTQQGQQQGDPSVSSVYQATRLGGISQAEIDQMYIWDPFFRMIVDVLPGDGTASWLTVQAAEEDDSADDGSDLSQAMDKAMRRLRVKQAIKEAWRLSRLDGGAAIVIVADDGRHPQEPLDLVALRKVLKLNVVSARFLQKMYIDYNVMSPTFGEPQWYQSLSHRGPAVGQVEPTATERRAPSPEGGGWSAAGFDLGRIHPSRVIEFQGLKIASDPARDEESLTYTERREGWGLPLLYGVYDELRDFHGAFSAAVRAMESMVIDGIGIKGLGDLEMDANGRSALNGRLRALSRSRSIHNMVLVDSEHETLARSAISLGGVDSTLMRFMEKLAAVSRLPMSRLFGMAPSGMSTDDRSGKDTWYAYVGEEQESTILDPLERLAEVIMASTEGPTGGVVSDDYEVVFNPLAEEAPLEQAQRRLLSAQASQVMVANNSITAAEARSALKNSADHDYTLDPDYDDILHNAPRQPDIEEQVERLMRSAQPQQGGERER